METEKMDCEEDPTTKIAPYVPGPNLIDISPLKDGGVLKEILVKSEFPRAPPPESKVICHYVGSLSDGTIFDSSRARNEPFSFNYGKGEVIKAWDIGVATMKKGEKAMIVAKPEYAYGEMGSPPKIPPNSTLNFEIELIDWELEDLTVEKDKGILREVLVKGKGHITPKDGALVKAELIGKYNGKIVDERTVEFIYGDGLEYNICNGLETAIGVFKRGEKSLVYIKSAYGFHERGNEELNIPPNADLEYEVKVSDFEVAKETWEMGYEERLQLANDNKAKGNECVTQKKYELALKKYQKSLELLDSDANAPELTNDEMKENHNLLIKQCRLNEALCYLKLDEPVKARNSCDIVLEMDPNNEKALFRRGQAFLAVSLPEEAKKDFEKILKAVTNHKEAAGQIKICNRMIREQFIKEKEIFSNMFDKFATQDKQREQIELDKQPDVMKTLGEWGQDEREHGMGDFEKENPNILLLNKDGEFKNM